jgi:hypothetical protein
LEKKLESELRVMELHAGTEEEQGKFYKLLSLAEDLLMVLREIEIQAPLLSKEGKRIGELEEAYIAVKEQQSASRKSSECPVEQEAPALLKVRAELDKLRAEMREHREEQDELRTSYYELREQIKELPVSLRNYFPPGISDEDCCILQYQWLSDNPPIFDGLSVIERICIAHSCCEFD